ncbi:uncharacterized protein LOC143818176 [Ranitomeya variabilis]|uniref:uncharacterized protein LOC143818176 n=1 Tax=Ranitomeya variabilis TaxID=490064 RepID=UPI00405791DE
MYLVTCDVESLYTSIRHEDGLNAVKFYLDVSDLDEDLCSFILTALRFILTHNFFMFGKTRYLQLRGTAMGASCAPSYANLFLGLWERAIFQTDPAVFCDIDDVLMIWHGYQSELDRFFEDLNRNNINVKLTYKSSKIKIDFLDILIQVDQDGYLQTDLYRKPTSTNTLLHASSQHPRHLIRNIPTGQFVRARRICSNESNFVRQAEDLQQRFLDRGYQPPYIWQAYRRALRSNRTALLNKQPGKPINDTKVRCILDFHSRSDEVHEILPKHWHVLRLDNTIAKIIDTAPSVTFRRASNLRDKLVHSHYTKEHDKYLFNSRGPSWGCTICGKCVACRNILTVKDFVDSSNQKKYVITHCISCTTKEVIYYGTCPCNLIYIGMTSRELRRRVREHILDIEDAREVEDISTLKTIPRHFRVAHGCDSSKFMVRGIDRVFPGKRGVIGKGSSHKGNHCGFSNLIQLLLMV